jgi:ubiquitin-protein ligase
MELSAITQKRLANELKDLATNKLEYAQVIQDAKNPMVFYFLLLGMKESAYEGGYYIGQLTLPKDYPVKPGNMQMITPSGRFEPKHNICLTNLGYHPESWTPIWSIRNMIIGFYSIFNSDETHGIAHIKMSNESRKSLAKKSVAYNIENHYEIFTCFNDFVCEDGKVKEVKEVKQEVVINKTVPQKVDRKNIYEQIKEMTINNFDYNLFKSIEKKHIIE